MSRSAIKTLSLAAALTAALSVPAAAQASAVTDVASGVLSVLTGTLTPAPAQQVRRGFGFSRPSFSRSTSSSRAVTTTNKSSTSGSTSSASSSTAGQSSTANANRTQSQQKDAEFSSSTNRTNTAGTAGTNTAGTTGNANFGQNFGGAGMARPAYGGGSPFLSSLTGTMTGMLLYSMLFPSTATAAPMTGDGAAAAGAAPAQPQVTAESLSDEELQQCLDELAVQQQKLEAEKAARAGKDDETSVNEVKQIQADLDHMRDLELTLVKEQVRRLKDA